MNVLKCVDFANRSFRTQVSEHVWYLGKRTELKYVVNRRFDEISRANNAILVGRKIVVVVCFECELLRWIH